MISKTEYETAIAQKKSCEELITQYHKEQQNLFDQRLKDNPIFTDEELRYSATARCLCGAGLAYPKACGMNHYWECSSILKGVADTTVPHTAQLPFMFYSIKGESEYNGSTREGK